jgi:hypothetical protein
MVYNQGKCHVIYVVNRIPYLEIEVKGRKPQGPSRVDWEFPDNSYRFLCGNFAAENIPAIKG